VLEPIYLKFCSVTCFVATRTFSHNNFVNFSQT